MPSTPMPALTLRHSTAHSSQNCGVRHAVSAVTAARDARRAEAGGGPSGGRPSRRRQPIAERAGHHRDEVDGAQHDERLPDADRCRRREGRISASASGVPIIAPPPNPMIASPVAMPRRSGNHLMSVETGEM